MRQTPPFISYNNYSPFDSDTHQNATLYVPQGSIDAYKSNYPWSNFKHIVEE